MVDRPDLVLGIGEHVASLAVGVVDDEVEQGDAAQILGVGLEEIEGGAFEVVGHERLDRADPHRAVPQHRGGHEAEATGPGDLEGGSLPVAEGPGGEVPQGRLATAWLVDDEALGLVAGCLCIQEAGQERVVGRAGHQSEQLHVSLEQLGGTQGTGFRQTSVRWPFEAKHWWPSGSIGTRHSGQTGRPWAATIMP